MSGLPYDVPPAEEHRARVEAAREAYRDRLDRMAWDADEIPPVDELKLRDWREHVTWDTAMELVRRRYEPR